MRVTFLGTGSAMPTGERHQTGLLLTVDDTALLLDCGSGVIHRLAQTDPGYEGIETVLLTHHHLDHVADLLPLLKARWLAGATTLTIAGPPGTRNLVEELLAVHDYMQDRVELSFRELDPGSVSVGGFELAAMETRHSMQCYAYRVSGPDGDFVYSGDSEAFDALADFADDARVLAHDCSFPDSVDVSNHPTPTQLGRVLAGREIGTVYLTHLYPHTDGQHEAMLTAIGEHYTGDVRIARDGLAIPID